MIGVQKTDGNLMFMYAIYLSALSIGNLIDAHMVQVFGQQLPASIVVYPVTLFVLCTVCELWTREAAQQLVTIALSIKFIGIVLIGLSYGMARVPEVVMPHMLWQVLGTSFEQLAGTYMVGDNIRFWAGSIFSFAIAQFVSIYAYELMFQRQSKHRRSTRHSRRWFRYLIASMAGETLEAVIILLLAFAPKWPLILESLLTQMPVRTIVTIILLPLFYLLTWKGGRCYAQSCR